jgi:hypothetical protein
VIIPASSTSQVSMSAFLGEIEISNTFPVLDIDKSDVCYVPSREGLAVAFSCFSFLTLASFCFSIALPAVVF